jgi:hypothetical protein
VILIHGTVPLNNNPDPNIFLSDKMQKNFCCNIFFALPLVHLHQSLKIANYIEVTIVQKLTHFGGLKENNVKKFF